MTTIVTRAGKGTPLTNTEVDTNFTNLNTDKLELGGTFSSGTANSVLFLNASKVATSGSALTFDGTNLFVGTSTNTNSSRIVSAGTISETVSSTQYLVASQFDIGTAANEIPLNQYLGNLAYQDAGSIAGQVGLSAGTAALPSLVSATDTDTGMWFPAANTLAWSTGGTRAMTLDASGQLVVGGTNPDGQFTVDNLTAPYMSIRRAGSTVLLMGSANSFVTSGSTADGAIRAANALVFAAGGATERARITSGGTFQTSLDASIYGVTVGRGAGAVATNTAVGASALAANTTGSDNTALGNGALYTNQGGARNTAVGSSNLRLNVSGVDNSAFGYGALDGTTGSYNTAVGSYALVSNTTASNNTAVGYQTLYSNQSGSQSLTAVGYQAGYTRNGGSEGFGSVYIGYRAGFGNTTGVDSVYIGGFSGNSSTGSYNTSIGCGSLYSNLGASNNTAVGYQAAYSNTGASNIAVGYQALYNGTTGARNTAVGTSAMGVGINTGSYHTALGFEALKANTSGQENTAIGAQALIANTTGNYNSALGVNTLLSNTTGSNNLAIGESALQNNTTASNNVAVGFTALFSNTTGVATFGTVTGGSGYTNGTYNGVQLTYSSGTAASTYPTANIVVSGGAVTTVTLVSAGTGFKDTTTVLTAPAASIGGTGSGFTVPVATLNAASNNTAVGYQAGYLNTGGNNFFAGYQSGYWNTSGTGNTSVGYQAYAQDNTATGSYNTAIGQQALKANTTASNNTAVGYQAGYGNQTGTGLTFVGHQAGYASASGAQYNMGIGYQSLYGATGGGTTGIYNTAVGSYRALYNNTTGSENSAFGMESLLANTTGAYNTAIGKQALAANLSASNNTAVGYQAGYSNQVGTSNVAIGYKAGYSNNSNGYNTFVGDRSGTDSTGQNNTFIGQESGNLVTSGAKNTILGRYNGNQGGLDIRTASNYIVLSDGDGNPRLYSDTNGNITIPTSNTARPIQFSDSQIIMNGQAGGWQIGLFFRGSAGTTVSGFGTLGNADSLDYNFVGPAYTNTFARFGSTGIGLGNNNAPGNGVGIRFPPTQSASSDANTLDDYEEGTFDPEVTFGGGSTGLTYTSKAGFYRKIGSLVFFSFRIVLSAKGSSTGNAKISIPFPAANISRPGGANLMYGTNFTTVTAAETTIDADQNTSVAALYSIAAGVSLTDANFQNTTDFIAAFCYISA